MVLIQAVRVFVFKPPPENSHYSPLGEFDNLSERTGSYFLALVKKRPMGRFMFGIFPGPCLLDKHQPACLLKSPVAQTREIGAGRQDNCVETDHMTSGCEVTLNQRRYLASLQVVNHQ